MTPPVKLVLLGPTAVGKTEAALFLAEKFGAEIVSADSMQIYRGMVIGTAQPSPVTRASVPHHMVGFVSPLDSYSVYRYVKEAWQVIGEIESRGALALITGGTGLYLRGLLQGLVQDDLEDPVLRHRLEQEVRLENIQQLREELQRVDPEKYAQFPAGDTRRILRAVVYHRMAHCETPCAFIPLPPPCARRMSFVRRAFFHSVDSISFASARS